MSKYHKISEYAYLAVAIFLTEETIRTWGDNNKTFMYIVMAVLALFMFFFKRWFRKKMERENSN